MVAETVLTPNDFIAPLFIDEGQNVSFEIPSMPGYYRYSIDNTIKEINELWSLGIKSVLLFIKAPDELKDNTGKEAWNDDGLMQRSIKAIKNALPEMIVMTDVALDPYSSYGHDGIVENGEIVNDPTVDALVKMSLSHAKAGADFVAPSDMMDGRVGAIRGLLDREGHAMTPIVSYAAKYASSFYGPFREAAESAPAFGDRRAYQMDPANVREALREVLLDVDEGADLVMVKPAGPYLDVIRQVRDAVNVPVVAYQVSGEFSLIKAAAARGWIDERAAAFETLTGIHRAGADLIITYYAPEMARWLSE